MVRVIGKEIPDNKRLHISLTYIYGIGHKLSEKVIQELKLNPAMKARELSADELAKLNSVLTSKYMVEGDLRRHVQNNIKRLIGIHCYRGLRHRLGLPVRGQRTQCNARTRKGRKKTVANKKI